ncbi:MAG TPA: undecaprenyl-diphosphate phosphatase [bacterium]|nr:undecaprenyl-diphosphate phosphatase [bacterium]
MIVFQALILGIAQGLTEFLPVSSSAHLVIIPWLFGWSDPVLSSLTFDVALHIGTLLAVLVFFARDWQLLINAGFKSVVERRIGHDEDRRMAWYIVLACIPGGFAGFLLENSVQASFHRLPIPQSSMVVMAFAIAAMGGILWLADHLGGHTRRMGAMRPKDALYIGLAQALAIFPGVSRSGSTITAGLALGFEREAAARFSFLLSAPIIAGAGLKSALELAKSIAGGAIASSELVIFPIGLVAASVTGFLCIRALMAFLRKHSTAAFAWYRWGLAAIVLAVALVRG